MEVQFWDGPWREEMMNNICSSDKMTQPAGDAGKAILTLTQTLLM